MTRALGMLEVHGWSTGMVLLDCLEKTAGIQMLQVELNDLYGACFRFQGSVAEVEVAMQAAKALGDRLHASYVTDIIPSPAIRGQTAWQVGKDFNGIIEQDVVQEPRKELAVSEQAGFAIGLIETQGLTAVIEAIDTACKTADVQIIAREKLGGGYITVVIKGNVASVQSAVAAGKARVEGLGKLIAAHVIPQPTAAVLSLLPKAG